MTLRPALPTGSRPARTARLWRRVRAFWRDTLVLTRQFRTPLIALGIMVFAASVIFYTFYRHPSYPDGLTALEAVYAVIGMIVLQVVVPMPGPQLWYLELFYLCMPVAGLALAAPGVANFVTLLFNRRSRTEEWQVAVISTLSCHVVIAGLGHLGFRILKELVALGEQCVVIERNPEAELRQRAAALDVPMLLGDARRAEMLEQAGVPRASAIVVCTDDDLANIEIGVRAREANPGIRVVLRMFDDEFAKKLAAQLGFETALSTSALSAPAFAGAAVSTEISQSFYVGDEVLSASRVTVVPRSQLVGCSVGELERALDLSVLHYQNGSSQDMHPAPEVTLAAGDQLIVFAGVPALTRLTQMNKARK